MRLLGTVGHEGKGGVFKESSMGTLIGVAAAGLIAVAIGVWLNAASRSTTDSTVGKATLAPSISPASISPASNATLVPTISIWEMHNQAHLENLPVQEVDDQSLVFSREGHR
jgi:hypothetical protein